ncbi:hypothetical protein SEMRO_2200_G318851.1 [Seminavis robusta]|uniref:Uncharacterized protein n=1 Tax=Seminavis robusta TaxID=568900 RepID=A0A9N8EUC1_9STRA|nr:hypothetical protein SEMRO_2200_G318851.1 [Seminavis robusta]|eukprot:Sro2200_g318851.1  (110) ;mRNA; f:15672-16001
MGLLVLQNNQNMEAGRGPKCLTHDVGRQKCQWVLNAPPLQLAGSPWMQAKIEHLVPVRYDVPYGSMIAPVDQVWKQLMRYYFKPFYPFVVKLDQDHRMAPPPKNWNSKN